MNIKTSFRSSVNSNKLAATDTKNRNVFPFDCVYTSQTKNQIAGMIVDLPRKYEAAPV